MNSALLYSLVEDATVPNVSLGGGISFEPNEHIYGSFSVFTTEETAGENPFDHTDGTTFSTEWIFKHTIKDRSGAQTLGVLYGIDIERTDIAADPRLVLQSVLLGQAIPATTDDTWAIYYNAHQYLWGDSDRGWGFFVRLGLSDGNPNPVRWNGAAGLAGKGLLPGREEDGWGLGIFYLDLSEEDLLKGLGLENEIGGELFYNLSLTPWFHITLDAQVIDPALPRSETACVLGVRTHINL
jgi:porin